MTISGNGSGTEPAAWARGAEKEWPGSGTSWTGASPQSASIPALVEEAKGANPEAWTELVSRFGMMIAATGRRYRLTPADVAELQQTTWLRLVENIHRVEQPERLGGWLATTARRESLHLLRRRPGTVPARTRCWPTCRTATFPNPTPARSPGSAKSSSDAAWEKLQPRCQEILSPPRGR